MDKIWAGELVDEPHGVPAEEAAGHHRRKGQPHRALGREDVHKMDLYEGQNGINNRKFNLNMQAVSFYLAHTVHWVWPSLPPLYTCHGMILRCLFSLQLKPVFFSFTVGVL